MRLLGDALTRAVLGPLHLDRAAAPHLEVREFHAADPDRPSLWASSVHIER
jgi:hypothetical protein